MWKPKEHSPCFQPFCYDKSTRVLSALAFGFGNFMIDCGLPHTTVVAVDQLWRLKDVALQQPAWRKLQLHKINKMKTLKLVVVVEVVAWNVRLGSSSSRLNAFFYCFDSNYSACHFWKQLWNRRRVSCWMVWLAVWVALEYVVELAELGYMPYCSTTLWPSLVGGLGGE